MTTDWLEPTRVGDLDGYVVRTPAATARVFAQGAHLDSWIPTGLTTDVLFTSANSSFLPGKAIRGGIPLCVPWFGAGPEGDRTPAHGYGRTSDWKLTVADLDGDAARLRFELFGIGSDHGFPGLHLEAEYTIGATLQIAVTATATARPVLVETALHTYLRVGDVTLARVDGLDGAEYLDKVAPGVPTVQQSGPVRFDGEVDRVYSSTATTSVVDPVLGRTITVAKTGSASTVVWNPGPKAAALGDLGVEQAKYFVCVEAGNVGEHAVQLEPGQAATTSATISAAIS